MTKALENITSKRFNEELYGYAKSTAMTTISDGDSAKSALVLDLSCKRQRDTDLLIKPIPQAPAVHHTHHHLHRQTETNNNNNNNNNDAGYEAQQHHHALRAGLHHHNFHRNQVPSEPIYSGYASSTPERDCANKSPAERSYILTPPSDDHCSSFSPKKIKLDDSEHEEEHAREHSHFAKFMASEREQQQQQQLMGQIAVATTTAPANSVVSSGHVYANVPAPPFPVGPQIFPGFFPVSHPAINVAAAVAAATATTTPPTECPSSTSPLLASGNGGNNNNNNMSSNNSNNGSEDGSKKAPRPFKAYPKDPLSLSLTSDLVFDPEVKQSYQNFRNRMLDSVKRTNEGVTNVKMRRCNNKSPGLVPPTTNSNTTSNTTSSNNQQQNAVTGSPNSLASSGSSLSSSDEKDAAYWERRRKNNEAAKRSRDARRAKEDEIAIKAAFFEQEYLKLKCENSLLKDELARLKFLYGH